MPVVCSVNLPRKSDNKKEKGPLALGGGQPHLPLCLLDELVLKQELTEIKSLFLK